MNTSIDPDTGDEAARVLRLQIQDLVSRFGSEKAWEIVSCTLLSPDVGERDGTVSPRADFAPHRDGATKRADFALHLMAYEQCYGVNALTHGPAGPAWFPTPEVIERANVTHAAAELGLPDYPSLHKWSVENREKYWEMAMRRLGIRLRAPYARILDSTSLTHPVWLPSAALNIVDSCFQADPGTHAITYSDGSRPITTMSVDELRRLTGRVENGLAEFGIAPGDAVAIVMPMTPESVAIYLGIIAAGAAVVSIADSFAPAEIAARLRISKAKLVFTQDVTVRGAKILPLYEKVIAVGAPATIVVAYQDGPTVALRDQDRAFTDFLSANDYLCLASRSPQASVNILFSSGTTGDPKAIPWDHTTPIKCAADAHFHHDTHPGDILCWPTSLGWMMGPWLIFAALINRATIALYGETPMERGFGQFVQDAKVTMLGLVPSLVRAWRQSGCMEGLDWTNIRAFSSSGECSNAADMLYLMHLAHYRPVIEYCGGTEIGGGYVTGTVAQPCVPATFTMAALGIDFLLLDSENHPQVQGEVFLHGPSIGLSTRLLNRDHDAVYFDGAPMGADGIPLRRHGDELISLPGGSYRMLGRTDDTMNLGGIKVSCVEIEQVLNQIDGVLETAAVAVAPPGGGPSRLIVFVVLTSGSELSETTLKLAMQQAIREKLNPLFRIDEVRGIDALPRTASNKIMRRDLRSIVSGASRREL